MSAAGVGRTTVSAGSTPVGGLRPVDAPVLEISEFSVVYRVGGDDVRAVQDVSLALHAGEVVGLAGESGSGKSTLAYGACRLLRAPAVITHGRVTYRGRRLPGPVEVLEQGAKDLRRLRWREIAIVFQSAMNALNPVLSVGDQLLDVIAAHLSLPRDEATARVESLLEMVSIPLSRIKSYPHELSGGMRQRVMIAMALATDPEVVIMDEPTTALDVVVQRDILLQIIELKEAIGFSVLFITHDLSLLLELADRVAVMYAGRLVELGAAASVHHEAAHPYTRGLLRSFPSLHGPPRVLTGIPGSPPDLRRLPSGCPFFGRCAHGTQACRDVDMRLQPVPGSADPAHVTACPFSLPELERVTTGDGPDAVTAKAAANNGTAVMEAKSLCKSFRLSRTVVLPAVRDLSLSLYRGAVVALVGESGSGKSTVARILAGQDEPTSGHVLLDGQAVRATGRKGFREYKRQVQMVFQDPFASLNSVHTVRHHLERPIRLHQGLRGADLESNLVSLMGQVRLTPAEQFLAKYPHELSGGQRQRVAIARALATQPRVLLADEPVSMLDVSIRLEMLNLLDELRRSFDLALLYITHDIASARYFADEILVMYAGQVVERGPAEDLTQNPAHPYTQLLVSSAPDPEDLGGMIRHGGNRGAVHAGENRTLTGACSFHPRCPLATDQCRTESPPMVLIDKSRAAACWRVGEVLQTPGPVPK